MWSRRRDGAEATVEGWRRCLQFVFGSRYQKARLCFDACDSMFAVASLLFMAVVAPGNKITHRIHVVEAKDCPKSERARRGDSVGMLLAAATRVDDVDRVSLGAAEQRHVVGRHPVPVVNKVLVGMCVGERRKASLYWDSQPGMQYMVE